MKHTLLVVLHIGASHADTWSDSACLPVTLTLRLSPSYCEGYAPWLCVSVDPEETRSIRNPSTTSVLGITPTKQRKRRSVGVVVWFNAYQTVGRFGKVTVGGILAGKTSVLTMCRTLELDFQHHEQHNRKHCYPSFGGSQCSQPHTYCDYSVSVTLRCGVYQDHWTIDPTHTTLRKCLRQ